MTQQLLLIAAATLVALGACTEGGELASDASPALPEPAAVRCAEAPQLRQFALNQRRAIAELRSDQQRIYAGQRANFVASLAIIAELNCESARAEADSALQEAFQAAREAEANPGSFYSSASRWADANYFASQVIVLLMQPPPEPPAA